MEDKEMVAVEAAGVLEEKVVDMDQVAKEGTEKVAGVVEAKVETEKAEAKDIRYLEEYM